MNCGDEPKVSIDEYGEQVCILRMETFAQLLRFFTEKRTYLVSIALLAMLVFVLRAQGYFAPTKPDTDYTGYTYALYLAGSFAGIVVLVGLISDRLPKISKWWRRSSLEAKAVSRLQIMPMEFVVNLLWLRKQQQQVFVWGYDKGLRDMVEKGYLRVERPEAPDGPRVYKIPNVVWAQLQDFEMTLNDSEAGRQIYDTNEPPWIEHRSQRSMSWRV